MKSLVIGLAVVFLLFNSILLPNLGGSGLEMPNNSMAWLGMLVILIFGIYTIIKNKKIYITEMQMVFLALCILTFIPVFVLFDQNFNYTPQEGIAFFLGLIFLVIIDQIRKINIRIILFKIIFLAVCYQAIIGILQNLGVSFCLGCSELKEGFYLSGTFQQRNIYSSFLAIGLSVSLLLLTKNYKAGKPFQYFCLIMLPVLSTLLILNPSRVGWVSLFIMIIGAGFLLAKKSFLNNRHVVISLLIALLSPVLFLNIDKDVSEISSSKVEDNTSIEIRKNLYSQTIDMILDGPFWGYGINHFETAYVEYTAKRHSIDSTYPPAVGSRYDHPHNEILLLIAERGFLPGFGILFLMLLLAAFIKNSNTEDRIIIIILLAPFVHVLTEYPLRQSAFHLFALIIFLSFIQSVSGKEKVINFNLSKLVTYPAMFILALCILLAQFYLVIQIRNSMVISLFFAHPEVFQEQFFQTRFFGPISFKMEMFINEMKYESGKKTPDPIMLQQYVEWAEVFENKRPRKAVFEKHVMALMLLDKVDEAREVYERAIYLYPNLETLEPK